MGGFPGTPQRMELLTRTFSVDPDDVIMSVHGDSEKNSELAVEVSGWRSERASAASPWKGALDEGARDEKRERRGARIFDGDLFACARVLRMQGARGVPTITRWTPHTKDARLLDL